MSMIASGALGTIAFELVATLERYEADMGALVLRWFDAGLWARVSDAMDAIQRCSASLPGVSVPAVALLIAHSELMHVLWRGGQVERVAGEHAHCIASLRRACLRRITSQHA